MYFWGLVSPKSQAPNFVLERKICVKRSDSQSPMMYAMLWVSTAVPLKDWKSKMYSEVTSYLQRTSRGLPQGFFFLIQIKQRGQSIGIREHTEVLNTVARKKVFHFDLKFKWLWSLWHVHIKCSAFPILIIEINSKLSRQQGNDKMC